MGTLASRYYSQAHCSDALALKVQRLDGVIAYYDFRNKDFLYKSNVKGHDGSTWYYSGVSKVENIGDPVVFVEDLSKNNLGLFNSNPDNAPVFSEDGVYFDGSTHFVTDPVASKFMIVGAEDDIYFINRGGRVVLGKGFSGVLRKIAFVSEYVTKKKLSMIAGMIKK
jgi:hypothetical protein